MKLENPTNACVDTLSNGSGLANYWPIIGSYTLRSNRFLIFSTAVNIDQTF